MDTTRHSLLIRVKDVNDKDAWDEFVRLYRPLMYRYALAWGIGHDNAEDIAQDCLNILTRAMPDFEYDRNQGSFKNWMRTIVNNKVREVLRKRREVEAETRHLQRPQQKELNPEACWEKVWLEEHLKFSMSRIRPAVNPTYYEIFKLLMFEEWSVSDICAHLSVNPTTVYNAKFRVGQKLKQDMTLLLGEEVQ